MKKPSGKRRHGLLSGSYFLFKEHTILEILLQCTFCEARSNSIIDFSLSSANTSFVRSVSEVSIRSKLPFNPLETQLVFSSSSIAITLLKTLQLCRWLLRHPLHHKYICQPCRQHQAHVIQHSHQVTFSCC